MLTAQCSPLLYNAADAAGIIKQSNPTNSSQKTKRKYSRPSFNADCRKMRQQYRRAKNVRRRVNDNENFQALNDSSKAYKECLNKHFKEYKTNVYKNSVILKRLILKHIGNF